MPQWEITDSHTGDTFTIESDEAPTQDQLSDLVKKRDAETPNLAQSNASFQGIKLSPYEQQVLGVGGRVSEPPIIDVPQAIEQTRRLGGKGIELLGKAAAWLPEKLEEAYNDPVSVAGRKAGRAGLEKVGLGGVTTPELPEPIPEPELGEKGIVPSLQRFGHGLTTKGSLLTLPLAGVEGVVGKGVQAMFAGGAAAGAAQSAEEFAQAETPKEKEGAAMDFTLNALLAAHMGTGAAKEVLKGEKIVSAAYVDDDGEIFTGANHPQIVSYLKLDGYDTRESRNVDRFGYWTNKKRYVNREIGGDIAKKAGQQLEPFDVVKGKEQAHSDEIASAKNPDEALGDESKSVRKVGSIGAGIKEAMAKAKERRRQEGSIVNPLSEGEPAKQGIIARGETKDNPSKDNAQFRMEWRARKLTSDEFFKTASEDERMKYDPKSAWVVEQRRVDIEGGKESAGDWQYPTLGKSKTEAIRNVGSTDFTRAQSLAPEHAAETKRSDRLNEISTRRAELQRQVQAPDRYTKPPLHQEFQDRYDEELRKRRLTQKSKRGEVDPKVIQQIKAPLLEEFKARKAAIEKEIAELDKEAAQLKSGKTKAAPKKVQTVAPPVEAPPVTPPKPPVIPPQPPAATPETTGGGGEKAGYGIAQRVREERAAAGQVDLVEPGEGTNAPDSVERGRQELARDPEAGIKQLAIFEADPHKAISEFMVATTRAHGEQLAKTADRLKDEHGADSEEYLSAKNALSDWDKRTKAIDTEWSKSGQAQQGKTDLDTGSFVAMERALEDAKEQTGGGPVTPEEKAEIEHKTKRKKAVDADVQEATERVNKALVTRSMSDAEKRAFDAANKTVREAAVRLAQAETKARVAAEQLKQATEQIQKDAQKKAEAAGRKTVNQADIAAAREENKARIAKAESDKQAADVQLRAEEKALDAASKTVRESAARVAAYENKARIAAEKLRQETEKVQKDAARRAEKAMNVRGKQAAIRLAQAETKARAAAPGRAKALADIEVKAAKAALDAVQKTVKEAATRVAQREGKARVDAAAKAKQAADVQLQAARKAQAAIDKRAITAAREVAARARKDLAMDMQTRVLNAARNYIENLGMEDLDQIKAKIGVDLGLRNSQVIQMLAKEPRLRFMLDDLWKKKNLQRKLQEASKRWITNQAIPGYEKALKAIPSVMFGAKVMFHGTVALGTHAPTVAFDPRFWKMYAHNYAEMYRMVGISTKGSRAGLSATAYHEALMRDLTKRKNYITARRAGLQNDPFQADEFADPDANALIQKWNKFSEIGNRGYSVLKLLRQDMFDYHWDRLNKELRSKAMAEQISDLVNHATGVTKKSGFKGASTVAFAPRLFASRFAWLLADPWKAGATGVKALTGRKLTPEEKFFAMEQVKSKGIIFGTYVSLLALNQGILSYTDSDQKINFFDPLRSDWLKFKGGGMTLAYGSPFLTLVRLPARIVEIAMHDNRKFKNMVYPDERVAGVVEEYARSQLSPVASTAVTLAFGSDWQRRPLPWSDQPVPKRLRQQGIEPYGYMEYGLEQVLPIPFEEAVREVWKTGLGADEEQLKSLGKSFATFTVMSGTGARLTDDVPYTSDIPPKPMP